MTTVSCERYANDPEANRSHLEDCESCRKAAAELDRMDEEIIGSAVPPSAGFTSRVAGSLPVAPWEGAGHRSWGLVAGGAIVLVAAAALMFGMMGVSPIVGVWAAIASNAAPRVDLMAAAESFAAILAEAPPLFHILIGISFVVVNVLFVLLLRRPPRGYDVSSR